ncbi:MAG TPA: VCBS repeat-containing protein, partial [Pyrinomonadaceae bacterium]|nr:VCBS repeat-containing protein [Pyrinomonadaceae bacterium]
MRDMKNLKNILENIKNLRLMKMTILMLVIFILSLVGTVFSKESVQSMKMSIFNQSSVFTNPFTFPSCYQTNYYKAIRTPDYDGDCKTDISVWQRSTGDFWYFGSSQSNAVPLHWGMTGDIPLDGDYDGDGKTDWAVFRKTTGYWYIKYTSNNVEVGKLFGNGASDYPVPADYDGDGITDLGILRAISEPG